MEQPVRFEELTLDRELALAETRGIVLLPAATGEVWTPLISSDLIKGSVTQDHTESLAVQDVAAWLPIPESGEIRPSGVGPTDAIKSASAEKGQAVLGRAIERYLALLRDMEQHYAPAEVPGGDVRVRPAQPRFEVTY
jgi:hypothetical protein